MQQGIAKRYCFINLAFVLFGKRNFRGRCETSRGRCETCPYI